MCKDLAEMLVTTRLPVIVAEPGEYVTRDGRRVTVHAVQPKESPYTFKVKGSLWRMYRGECRPRGSQAWHVSGRLDMVKEKAGDIVGRYLDSRYSVTKEYCGETLPVYVARFCDKWIGKADTKAGAFRVAEQYELQRQRDLTGKGV